jgi:hypothetical protein
MCLCLLRYQKNLARQELLIVDEPGFVPLSKTGAEMLFEVFSQRYERTSTNAKFNQSPTNAAPPDGWFDEQDVQFGFSIGPRQDSRKPGNGAVSLRNETAAQSDMERHLDGIGIC